MLKIQTRIFCNNNKINYTRLPNGDIKFNVKGNLEKVIFTPKKSRLSLISPYVSKDVYCETQKGLRNNLRDFFISRQGNVILLSSDIEKLKDWCEKFNISIKIESRLKRILFSNGKKELKWNLPAGSVKQKIYPYYNYIANNINSIQFIINKLFSEYFAPIKIPRINKKPKGSSITSSYYKVLKLDPCAYCGKKKSITMDHIIPKSRGGTNGVDNIAPACKECNNKKDNTTLMFYLFENKISK